MPPTSMPDSRRPRSVTHRVYATTKHQSTGRAGDLIAVVLVFGILMVIPAGVTRLASSDVRDYAALRGTVSVLSVRGPSDSRGFPVWVWRPPGPDSASIPVIYLLHGYPGAAKDAFSSGLAAILNRRLEEGYPPVVVACPDGNGEHHSDTEWANSWNGSDQVMSRVVSSDIAAVEGAHRRPAWRRVIAGFSMGGYGAMNIAMQNPGVFGQVVSISGYFVINDLSDMFGDKPRPAGFLHLPGRLLAAARRPRGPVTARSDGGPGDGGPVLGRVRVDAVLEQLAHPDPGGADLVTAEVLGQLLGQPPPGQVVG
jgi:pimeloyl-ACP methyl ester carboxylesterase